MFLSTDKSDHNQCAFQLIKSVKQLTLAHPVTPSRSKASQRETMKRMAVLMEVHVQQAAAHLFQQAGVRNQTPVRGVGRTMSTDSLNTPKNGYLVLLYIALQ